MAQTATEQDFTLTKEQFYELAKWDIEEEMKDGIFNYIIADNYKRERWHYKTDQEWFYGERVDLSLGKANFEVGWYRQLSCSLKDLLNDSKKEIDRLKNEKSEVEKKMWRLEGELKHFTSSYRELQAEATELRTALFRAESKLNEKEE